MVCCHCVICYPSCQNLVCLSAEVMSYGMLPLCDILSKLPESSMLVCWGHVLWCVAIVWYIFQAAANISNFLAINQSILQNLSETILHKWSKLLLINMVDSIVKCLMEYMWRGVLSSVRRWQLVTSICDVMAQHHSISPMTNTGRPAYRPSVWLLYHHSY